MKLRISLEYMHLPKHLNKATTAVIRKAQLLMCFRIQMVLCHNQNSGQRAACILPSGYSLSTVST